MNAINLDSSDDGGGGTPPPQPTLPTGHPTGHQAPCEDISLGGHTVLPVNLSAMMADEYREELSGPSTALPASRFPGMGPDEADGDHVMDGWNPHSHDHGEPHDDSSSYETQEEEDFDEEDESHEPTGGCGERWELHDGKEGSDDSPQGTSTPSEDRSPSSNLTPSSTATRDASDELMEEGDGDEEDIIGLTGRVLDGVVIWKHFVSYLTSKVTDTSHSSVLLPKLLTHRLPNEFSVTSTDLSNLCAIIGDVGTSAWMEHVLGDSSDTHKRRLGSDDTKKLCLHTLIETLGQFLTRQETASGKPPTWTSPVMDPTLMNYLAIGIAKLRRQREGSSVASPQELWATLISSYLLKVELMGMSMLMEPLYQREFGDCLGEEPLQRFEALELPRLYDAASLVCSHLHALSPIEAYAEHSPLRLIHSNLLHCLAALSYIHTAVDAELAGHEFAAMKWPFYQLAMNTILSQGGVGPGLKIKLASRYLAVPARSKFEFMREPNVLTQAVNTILHVSYGLLASTSRLNPNNAACAHLGISAVQQWLFHNASKAPGETRTTIDLFVKRTLITKLCEEARLFLGSQDLTKLVAMSACIKMITLLGYSSAMHCPPLASDLLTKVVKVLCQNGQACQEFQDERMTILRYWVALLDRTIFESLQNHGGKLTTETEQLIDRLYEEEPQNSSFRHELLTMFDRDSTLRMVGSLTRIMVMGRSTNRFPFESDTL